MPRLKVPTNVVPPAFRPRPKRAGDEKVKPIDQAKEAGITAVDWVDERTSLSGAARWMMFRKIPRGTNWFYTLGSATMFAFLSQAGSGSLGSFMATAWAWRDGAGRGTGRCRRAAGRDRGRSRSAGARS